MLPQRPLVAAASAATGHVAGVGFVRTHALALPCCLLCCSPRLLLSQPLRACVQALAVAANDLPAGVAQAGQLLGAQALQGGGIQCLPRCDEGAAPAVGAKTGVGGNQRCQAGAPVLAVVLAGQLLEGVASSHSDGAVGRGRLAGVRWGSSFLRGLALGLCVGGCSTRVVLQRIAHDATQKVAGKAGGRCAAVLAYAGQVSDACSGAGR